MLQGAAVPLRSTTSEEQLRLMNEANKALTPLMTQRTIFCMNETRVLRWNSGVYGWRCTEGCDTIKTTFSKQTVKLFGVLAEDATTSDPLTS